MLGCQMGVLKCTFGGSMGYSLGKNISTSKTPPSYGVSPGPSRLTWICLKFFGFQFTVIPSSYSLAIFYFSFPILGGIDIVNDFLSDLIGTIFIII